jgi:hypothetical protein
MSLWRELERRNVIRIALAYLAGAWLVIQIADTVLPRLGFSDSAVTNVIIVLAIGFVPAVVLAWLFDLTPEGLKRDADLAADAPARSHSRLNSLIVVTLALAVGYFCAGQIRSGSRPGSRDARRSAQRCAI